MGLAIRGLLCRGSMNVRKPGAAWMLGYSGSFDKKTSLIEKVKINTVPTVLLCKNQEGLCCFSCVLDERDSRLLASASRGGRGCTQLCCSSSTFLMALTGFKEPLRGRSEQLCNHPVKMHLWKKATEAICISVPFFIQKLFSHHDEGRQVHQKARCTGSVFL